MNEINSQESPLVTYAVFAYNQERYIREAIEAAFSQTYEPLEIILSDDCSTDSTFKIMKEMARAYEGKHSVIVRKNDENMGTLDHVITVAQLASGPTFVLAAGDDISDPNRTSILASWIESGANAVYSGYKLIDPNGKFVYCNINPYLDSKQRIFWLNNCTSDHFVYGATSCYNTDIIKSLGPVRKRDILSEDVILNTLLQLKEANIKFIPEPLVSYRAHPETVSSSNEASVDCRKIKLAEKAEVIKNARREALMLYIQNSAVFLEAISGLKSGSIDLKKLSEKEAIYKFKSKWYALPFFDKLIFAFGNKVGVDRQWMIPRLFGISAYAVFAMIKKTIMYKSAPSSWFK